MARKYKVNQELIDAEAASETMERRVRNHANLSSDPHSVFRKIADGSVAGDSPIQVTPYIWKAQLRKLVYLMDEFGWPTMGLALGKIIDHAFQNEVLNKHKKSRKATDDIPKPPPKSDGQPSDSGIYGNKWMGL